MGNSSADRAWVADAVRIIEADFNRSADTHLLSLPLPGAPHVALYAIPASATAVRSWMMVGSGSKASISALPRKQERFVKPASRWRVQPPLKEYKCESDEAMPDSFRL
jgi:hypothetical protein